MKKLLFILLFPILTISQEFTFVEKEVLEADTFIGKDSYQNTYFISEMSLNKQGVDGLFIFNDFQLGSITSVDITNPLNIVLYYKDVNTVVLLDNQLAEIERINFNLLPEYIATETASNAGNNQLWIFNNNNQQLELFNYRTLSKTTNSQPFAGKIIGQTSNFNVCYILTEEYIYGFNRYGSLLTSQKVDGISSIFISEEKLILQNENTLFYVSEKTIQPIKLPLPEIVIKDLQITTDLLYIYDGNFLHTFRITQPK